MDHTVVTIFCCGTGEHRDQLNNVVPYTWRATGGSRVWLNDGPGNGQHHILKSEKILKKVSKGKGSSKRSFKTHHTTWFDNLSGVSTQDNIVNTLQWLWMEYYRPDKPTFKTINLCGWSRGAVTCIMLSHAIQAAGFPGLIPDLKVNLFCIDPVPGLTNDFGTSGSFEKTGRAGTPTSLPQCVSSYCAVLAENVGGVKGYAFTNVSPSYVNRGRSADKAEFPFPGTHSNVAKMNNVVGELSASLCHKFLSQHGTAILLPKVMTDGQELEQYAKILVEHGSVKNKEFKKWDVAGQRSGSVVNGERNHKFYVNSHHSGLMRQLLPRVAGYLAGQSPLPTNEIGAIASRYPHTHGALKTAGFVE